jgi:hypothetical protein
MSSVPVRIFFEGEEMDITLCTEKEIYEIVRAINSMWQAIEKDPIVFRALPTEEGLCVFAGTVAECRCSEAEVLLEDPYDLDDHHFCPGDLPEDLDEKTILVEDPDGRIHSRFLVGEFHRLGLDNLWVMFG